MGYSRCSGVLSFGSPPYTLSPPPSFRPTACLSAQPHEEACMGERNDDIEGQPHDDATGRRRATGEPEAGEDVAGEARSVEGIPASPQGDGEGDNEARGGALEHHRPNPAIGEVG